MHAFDASIEQGRGFILVSAPAGSGKSTLLSGWLTHHDRPAAWLQVDEGDDDPARFWAFVAGALRAVERVVKSNVAFDGIHTRPRTGSTQSLRWHT